MFTNPLNRKYQTGGKISKQQYAKAFVSWLKTNKDGFKDKSESEIVQAISDMSKSKDGKKATASLRMEFEKNNPEYKGVLDDSKTENAPKKEDTSEEQESKFADGGKMQSFICKHAHGGDINCGCEGMVVRAAKGEQLPDGNIFSGWTRNVRRWINLPDGSTQSVETIVSPDGQTGYERIITDRSRMQNRNGMAVRDTSYNGGAYIDGNLYIDASQDLTSQEKSDLNAYLDNKPQSKQEGGLVLTRRQARELSGLNRGYNRSNFQTAMANADLALRNAGLRGKELRQAKRRMVAGINVEPTPEVAFTDNTVPEIVVNPTIQQAVTLAELPTRETLAQSINTNRRRRDYARSGDYNTNVDTNVVLDMPVITSEDLTGRKNRFTGLRRQATPTQSTSTSPTYSESVYTNPNTQTGGWSPERMREDIYQFGPGVPWGRAGLIEEPEKPIVIDWSKSSTWDPYIRMNNGPLSPYQMELIRVLTANPNATINDLRGGWTPETFAAAKQKFGFKCGGQIEKHQDDNGIIGHYRNKWSNDWNNIKRGWNNFKDSAIGLVVPTSGTDIALMAAGPMFKIAGKAAKASNAIEAVGDVGRKVLTKTGKSVTIIPEGVYGSEKAAKRALTESAPFISQKGELANEAARNINGLRKWLYGGWYNATTNLPK